MVVESPSPPAPSAPLRALELYCGIGGFAAAVAGRCRVVAAVDISRPALAVYRENFAHPTLVRTLDTVAPEDLAGRPADLWWLSPPCQPFTRRGHRRDDADPRSQSLLRLLPLLESSAPTYLGLENVPGFAGSRVHAAVRDTLDRAGYQVRELLVCPTELGIPNRRRRFYLVAGRGPLRGFRLPAPSTRPLSSYLDPGSEPDPSLRVGPELLRRYRGALDVVDAADPEAVTACFTAAYGRSPVRSGSYLRQGDGSVRRFDPREVLALLGFPPAFRLPPALSRRKAWQLAGASLSLPAVRAALSAIPGLMD